MRKALLLLGLLVFAMPVAASNAHDLFLVTTDGEIWTNCDTESCNVSILVNDSQVAQGTNLRTSITPGNFTLRGSHLYATDYILSSDNSEVTRCEDDCIGENLLPKQPSEFSGVLYQSRSIAFESLAGDIIGIRIDASSADLKMELRNSTNTILTAETQTNTSSSTQQDWQWIAMEESLSLSIRLTSQTPDMMYRVQVTQMTPMQPLALDDSQIIIGYGTARIDVPMVQSEHAAIEVYSTNGAIKQHTGGEWSHVENMTQGEHSVWSMGEGMVLGLFPDGPQPWRIDVTLSLHADGDLSHDAPGMVPLNPTTDLSSWPNLSLEGEVYNAELTLPILDDSDVFLFTTEGWPESIHLVQITLEGDIENLALEMWDMEQSRWEALDHETATISDGKIRLTIQVGLGIHPLRVYHIDDNITQNQEWGANAPLISYTIYAKTSLVDEGEEPWFPPDETAMSWGTRVRWFLGGLLLIPVAWFLVSFVRESRRADDLRSFERRLEWLSKRLETTDIGQVKRDLKDDLKAVSRLTWEESIHTWGEPTVQHQTSGIQLAMWKLDERLSEGGGLPLLVGVNVLENNWEIAALRFEAPSGGSWRVDHVWPRLLYREHEVFLDLLASGTSTYIQVELRGDANSIDIHLSGMMNGEAIAAKPSRTLRLEEE